MSALWAFFKDIHSLFTLEYSLLRYTLNIDTLFDILPHL